MKLYNTLSRSIEALEPPERHPVVTMYVCGPTVYDDPHIGHARSAYTFDLLRRYLRFRGYQVRFVRNVTDVDDKIIDKARQLIGSLAVGKGPTAAPDLRVVCGQVAERYLTSYHAAMDRLGIERPDVEPLATAHVVPQMTDFIAKLLMQGAAYEAGGDVYFAVRKSEGYGKLSHRALDELKAGARVEPGEHKQDPLDFALWKVAKSGEPSWNSPWGPGRPGWHIECSAMSTHYLGDTFDIHGGGVDLVFPHHENEIAQAQAAGKSFARCWVHNGLLTVNGEKMSKSLGNFITVEEALAACGGEPGVLKMLFLGAHYRSPLDYSARSVKAALSRYHRVAYFCHRVANTDPFSGPRDLPIPDGVPALYEEFLNAMDDDLNTPHALAALDALVTLGYEVSDPLGRHHVMNTVFQVGRRLGVFTSEFTPVRLTPGQQRLLSQREAARQRRDFATADQIRAGFASDGLEIEDTPEGPVVLPASKK